MATHRRSWQRVEERAAGFFGARRQAGSGSASNGREDQTASDSTHPTLFVEAKLRDKHAVRTLFDQVKRRAEKEKKVPLICLFDKHRPGFLLCVHSADIGYVVAQYVAALDSEERDELDFLIEQARTRRAPGWSRGGQ
jgi:hypothetical protein